MRHLGLNCYKLMMLTIVYWSKNSENPIICGEFCFQKLEENIRMPSASGTYASHTNRSYNDALPTERLLQILPKVNLDSWNHSVQMSLPKFTSQAIEMRIIIPILDPIV